jgi:hypothetical protein
MVTCAMEGWSDDPAKGVTEMAESATGRVNLIAIHCPTES